MPPEPRTVLGPGDVFYTVLIASPVLGPGGVTNYETAGPWDALNLAAASAFSEARPGSLLAVTTVLHASRPAPAAAAPNVLLRRKA